jgi:hypothetical protein
MNTVAELEREMRKTELEYAIAQNSKKEKHGDTPLYNSLAEKEDQYAKLIYAISALENKKNDLMQNPSLSHKQGPDADRPSFK